MLATIALFATFMLSSPAAAEDPVEEDVTITTVLRPGWNMVGWLGRDTAASALFEAIPALEQAGIWDPKEKRYRWRFRDGAAPGGLFRIPSGAGLWLNLDGDQPHSWTREGTLDSTFLDLHEGDNFVTWFGRDGVGIQEAVSRLGSTLTKVVRWNAEDESFEFYSPAVPRSLNTFRALRHGDAIWLSLSDDAVWWQTGRAPPPVVFLGEFSEGRKAEILSWIEATQALAAERWRVQAPFTTYLGARESVAATYQQVRGTDNVTICGNYSQSVIFLVDLCINGGAHAHEYFHAIQFHLMGAPAKRVPTWMIEGTATLALVIFRATQSPTQSVEERLQQSRLRSAALLGSHVIPPLSVLEDHDQFHNQPGGLGWTLGNLATLWLEQRLGDSAFVDFFRELRDAPDWRQAFRSVFGMSASDFYEEFADYRAEVAPLLPHVTDAGDGPVLQAVGMVPLDAEQSVRDGHGDVVRFFSRNLGVDAGEYTVFFASEPESVSAAHERAFGQTLPSRFCQRADAGVVAVIDLSCPTRSPEALVSVHFDAAIEALAPWDSLPKASTRHDRRGPYWLVEPAKTYMLYALHRTGEADPGDEIWSRELVQARSSTRLLSEMETIDGLNEQYWPGRAIGFLAIDRLAALAGLPALMEYYRQLPLSKSWQEAFAAAFAMSIGEFYADFEEYREEVARPLPHLTDNLTQPVIVFVGHMPEQTKSAIRGELAMVLKFFGGQLDAPATDYTVYIGNDAEALSETYERYFDAKLSDRFCSSAATGRVAFLAFRCSMEPPYGLAWRHFHTARHILAGTTTLPPSQPGEFRQGPAWLVNGSANYAVAAYQIEHGRQSAEQYRNRQLARVASVAGGLESIESHAAFIEDSATSHALSGLAAQWLTDRAGLASLFRYYRVLDNAAGWRVAFEAAFGITVDDFYEEFERFLAELTSLP